MNDAQRKAVQLLTLPDRDYFAFDEQRALAIQAQLAASFDTGVLPPPTAASETPMFVAIGAPHQIDFAYDAELPVLLALRYTGQREWEAHYQQNIWLVAVELDSGDARIGRLFNPGKRELQAEPSLSGAPPDSIDAEAVYTDVQRIDLRRAVAHDWRPARFAVTAIFYDWPSNTVLVEPRGGGKDEGADEATRQLQFGRPSSFLTAIDFSAAPALVDGIAFTLQSDMGRSATVTLALDLPSGQQALVMDREQQALLLKTTLLLLRLDDNAPMQIELLMPINLLNAKNGGSRLRGAVQFDLRAAATGQTLAGAYQVYLLAGDRVIGPQPIILK